MKGKRKVFFSRYTVRNEFVLTFLLLSLTCHSGQMLADPFFGDTRIFPSCPYLLQAIVVAKSLKCRWTDAFLGLCFNAPTWTNLILLLYILVQYNGLKGQESKRFSTNIQTKVPVVCFRRVEDLIWNFPIGFYEAFLPLKKIQTDCIRYERKGLLFFRTKLLT